MYQFLCFIISKISPDFRYIFKMIEAFRNQIINMTFKIQVRIQIYSQQSYRFWKPKTTIRKENIYWAIYFLSFVINELFNFSFFTSFLFWDFIESFPKLTFVFNIFGNFRNDAFFTLCNILSYVLYSSTDESVFSLLDRPNKMFRFWILVRIPLVFNHGLRKKNSFLFLKVS